MGNVTFCSLYIHNVCQHIQPKSRLAVFIQVFPKLLWHSFPLCFFHVTQNFISLEKCLIYPKKYLRNSTTDDRGSSKFCKQWEKVHLYFQRMTQGDRKRKEAGFTRTGLDLQSWTEKLKRFEIWTGKQKRETRIEEEIHLESRVGWHIFKEEQKGNFSVMQKCQKYTNTEENAQKKSIARS